MRDIGEPVSRGRADHPAARRQAFTSALVAVALFAGVVFVHGLLAIALIELLQNLGWWQISGADGSHASPPGPPRELLGSAPATVA